MESQREELNKELKEVKEAQKEAEKKYQAEADETDRIVSIIVSIIYAGGTIPLIIMCSKDVTIASHGVYLWVTSCLFIACIANIFDKILKGHKNG